MGEHAHASAEPYRTSRRTLPVLDDLRVASPCSVSWDSMIGNGRARTCAECNKKVFNISGMKRADAELFLLERGGEGACVTFFRRADGTILTADCPMQERLKRRARSLTAVAAAALAGLLGLIGLSALGLGQKVTQTTMDARTTGFACGN